MTTAAEGTATGERATCARKESATMTVSNISRRTSKWAAWRRRGATLVGLAIAANPHLAGPIGAWATLLGAGLVRSGWRARRALRALTRIAGHVPPSTRFVLTATGAAALEAV
jgi:hypothetical protein